MRTTDVRVLAAYLAPLLTGARVLYVGDLDDAGPLFDAGARLVHVYRFTKPAAPLQGAVLVQPFERGLDLPSGGFDLAVVDDLGRVGSRLDLLASLRGGLGARGVAALVADTGAGQLDYDELYDSCSTLFENVKMVARLPFTGTLLCELGLETEPDVSVDTELAELEAPQTLLALVSQRSFVVDEYAIFAHPQHPPLPVPTPAAVLPAPVVATLAPVADLAQLAEMSELTLQNQALRAQLQEEREVRTNAAALSRELESAVAASATAREEALQLRNALAAALAEQAASGDDREIDTSELELDATLAELALQSERAEQSEARAQSVEARLETTERRVAALEAALKAAQESLQAAEAKLQTERSDSSARIARIEAQRHELEASERRVRAELARITAETADTIAALAAARDEALAAAHARASEPPHDDDDDEGDDPTDELEAMLRDRGRTVLELQAELARRARMITQLLLAERLAVGGRSSRPTAQLEHKLDELAREVARREGELEARGWRIQELETALAATAKTPDSFR